MAPTILLIATLDTKGNEALFLKRKIKELGCNVLIMDTGILDKPLIEPDIPRTVVAKNGGMTIEDLLSTGDKGICINTMIEGAKKTVKALYKDKMFNAVLSIGGAQGTDLGTATMRELPFGVPKFMVSTIASGFATFGPYVGTKDIIMMHSVADIQGLNKITKTVLANAAAAVCGMVLNQDNDIENDKRPSVAMSMLGTTTPGALRAKGLLEKKGYEVIAFHQNGTGGIAMEDFISDGMFIGVLDINLHELADLVVGGLHRSIREYRLENAGKLGIPQVIAPGSINYSVQGPFETLPDELKQRKYIIHNPNLTLVRLSPEELVEVAKLVAKKLNVAKGPVHVFIPLKGFSYPDRVGLPHWEPETNLLFINVLKEELNSKIPVYEIDAHINDPEFIDRVVDNFLDLVN